MSLATKQPSTSQPRGMKRIWKAPTSKARWFWLVLCIVFYAGIFGWYLYAIKTQQFPGPINDPLRLFGIISSVLILATAAYSLRRRFVRSLPGKVQDWLWMHIWVGVTTILLVFLHENFAYITHDFAFLFSSLTDSYWAALALFSLLFLVLSGIIGRLLDIWQTRVIATDASTNGVGIVRALGERILELEYTVERLSAGKSEAFKSYCLQALEKGPKRLQPSALPQREHADFERAYDILNTRAQLVQSQRQQQRARVIISTWRTIHITLACVALLIILYHSIMELLTNVFNLFPPA